MSFLGLLDKKATIERATPSISDEGYVTNAWAEVAADVPCSLQKASGATRQEASGEVHRADFVCYLPYGTDIRPEVTGKADRVKIDGQYYLAVDVRTPPGRRNI